MSLKNPKSTSRRLIIVAILLATLLGGAYIGFTTSGPSISQQEATRLQNGSEASKKRKAVSGKSNTASATLDDAGDNATDGENDLHRRIAKFLASGDDLPLRTLTPKGVDSVEGAGGFGLNRQVKAHGAWYPVFDLSKAKKKDGSPADDLSSEDVDPNSVELAEIPLAIASPPPPPVITGQTLNYQLAAVGGTPPYSWSASSDSSTFFVDAASGLLNGISDEPLTQPMTIAVTDAEGAQSSTQFTLIVRPAEPLTIITGKLPVVEVRTTYQTQLQAQGGLPPYTWSMNTPVALTCDPASGMVTGTLTEPGDYEAHVTVTDAQQTAVEAKLTLTVSAGLEITSESPLPAATPGERYQFQFEATGGTPPYTWTAKDFLPPGMIIRPEGMLEGTPGNDERLYQITIMVTDADGLTFKATMELAVMQSLIAVPSNQRAGLAWRPPAISRTLKKNINGFSIVRSGGDSAVEVYRGTASNFVDHDLAVGAAYDYQLFAHTADGQKTSVGKRSIVILPMSLQRGRAGATGDPYADRVVRFDPLSQGGYGVRGLPSNVTGPPDGRSTYSAAYTEQQVASLHASTKGGGSITLEFTDNIIESGPGMDFTVFENVFFRNGDPNQRFMEPAMVDVALFEGEWFKLPAIVSPAGTPDSDVKRPTYYSQGFAGVSATTGEDPTDASRSGGDSFDLGATPLSWFRYVRIRSTGDNVTKDRFGTLIRHTTEQGAASGGGSSGFDLDAVSAVNY